MTEFKPSRYRIIQAPDGEVVLQRRVSFWEPRRSTPEWPWARVTGIHSIGPGKPDLAEDIAYLEAKRLDDIAMRREVFERQQWHKDQAEDFPQYSKVLRDIH